MKMNETYTAVIIDDEKSARDGLKTLINMNFPEIEIIAEADSVDTGVQFLNHTKPDLLLLDIKLFDGSGFTILEQLGEIKFQTVFITAYENFAIRAFEVNALDYILKPISVKQLRITIEKVKQRLGERTQGSATVHKVEKKLAIRESDGIRFVKINDILRCQSNSNYTHIHLVNGKSILTARTLKDYDELLKKYGFFRAHQSHLICLNKVSRIVNKNGLYVEMESGDLVKLSKKNKEALLSQLAGIQLD